MVPDDEAIRLGIEWFTRERESVEKLCRRLSSRVPHNRRQQVYELAIDEAQRTIPMAMLTYHPNGATLRTHVLGTVRWYVWKKIIADLRDGVREYQEEFAPRDYYNEEGKNRYYKDSLRLREHEVRQNGHVEFFASDTVQYLKRVMQVEQFILLEWRFLDDLSIDEIADLLDCSKTTAWRYLQDAIEAAREYVQG